MIPEWAIRTLYFLAGMGLATLPHVLGSLLGMRDAVHLKGEEGPWPR